jgi:hypothetical protein
VPAPPSSVLEPLWVQVAALLPTRQVRHPLAATGPASLTGSCSTSSSRCWSSAAATAASPTTPARRPPAPPTGRVDQHRGGRTTPLGGAGRL